MQLSSDELDDLTRFFAKRFPSPGVLGELAREVGVEPADSGSPAERWGALLLGAQAQGRTLALARGALARAPDDPNLRELVRTMEADRAAARRPVILGVVVAASLLLGVLGWQLTRPAAPGPAAPPRGPELSASFEEPSQAPQLLGQGGVATKPGDGETAAGEPSAGVSAEVTPADGSDGAAVAEASGAAAVGSSGVPAGVSSGGPSAPHAAASATPAEPAAIGVTENNVGADAIAGRCGGPPREVIGYWYAGAPFEARAGQTYTVRSGANVRVDYPRRANGWSSGAKVVCALVAGDELRLSVDPILIEGGKYWVPLTPRDLLSR